MEKRVEKWGLAFLAAATPGRASATGAPLVLCVLLAFAGSALAGCGAPPLQTLPGRAPATLRAQERAPFAGIENFSRVNEGLYRGGLPDEAGFAALKKRGVRTIVSLLGAGQASQREVVAEERQAAEGMGFRFVNLQVPYQTPSRSLVDRFLATVEDPANQPAYVHCKHGRDRTGTMIALYRIAEDGYTGRRALAEMESFGFEPARFPYYTKLVLSFAPGN